MAVATTRGRGWSSPPFLQVLQSFVETRDQACLHTQVPVSQSVRLSSTRRFCARPDAVLLLATG
jgi:hypothetical protein